MINLLSTTCSNFIQWKDEILEECEGTWKYFTKERCIPQGFPVAVVSSIAAAYLFNCSKLSTGAVFGAVNYITLTSLLEIVRVHHEIDHAKAGALIGLSGAISMAFIQTVCKTSISYQTSIILGIAAFAGQLTREFFVDHEDNFEF